MANIPSHMKIRSDLAFAPQRPKTSMFMLIAIGVAIGLASASIALIAGLIA
jgi:hypothetical protein